MSRQKKDAEANWKSQKAWEVAQAPFKNLLINDGGVLVQWCAPNIQWRRSSFFFIEDPFTLPNFSCCHHCTTRSCETISEPLPPRTSVGAVLPIFLPNRHRNFFHPNQHTRKLLPNFIFLPPKFQQTNFIKKLNRFGSIFFKEIELIWSRSHHLLKEIKPDLRFALSHANGPPRPLTGRSPTKPSRSTSRGATTRTPRPPVTRSHDLRRLLASSSRRIDINVVIVMSSLMTRTVMIKTKLLIEKNGVPMKKKLVTPQGQTL
ncbi:hypothetical protein LWI29_026969 [Acer saccharum]|uniref:Uncharacterized protein n=1 Tax=Acer saccharum TaxID=4024 RepID=A0AA39W2I5_ACESA|nr:hypothetical protein LWI29_026969 [Acer saccharum]